MTDRVVVRLPAEYEDLRPYHERIMREVLALGIETGPSVAIEVCRPAQTRAAAT